MSCEIGEAIDKLNARMDATFGVDDDGGGVATEKEWTPMFVGTGLDPEHVHAHSVQNAQAGMALLTKMALDPEHTLQPRESLAMILSGTWTQGMIVGLLIAEARAQKEAAARDPAP